MAETWIGKPIEKVVGVAKGVGKATGNVVNKVCGEGVTRDAYNKLGSVKR